MKPNRYRIRLGAIPLMVLALVVATASAAFAHYVYERAEVWQDGAGNCVINRSEISHGSSGGGYSQVNTQTNKVTNTPWGDYPCTEQWQLGPGYKRARIKVLKWTGSQWGLCRDSGQQYNSQTVSIFIIEMNMGATPDCGSGSYGTEGHGAAKKNGNWVGGEMWSGSHQLP